MAPKSFTRTPQGRNLQRYQQARHGASVTAVGGGLLPDAGVPPLGGVRIVAMRGKRPHLSIYISCPPFNILPPLSTPLSRCHLSRASLCSSSLSQAPFLPSLPLSLPALSRQDSNITTPPSGLEPASPLIPQVSSKLLPPFSAHLTSLGQVLI